MDSKKPNKIRDIVRLQQLGKKWRKLANAPKNSGKKGISFLKRTLSFSDASRMGDVPKGYLAVCAGKEMKRFIIPTDYLSHYAFVELLKEAEEEFGFQNEGVLRIPCDADVFERILKMVEEDDGDGFYVKDDDDDVDDDCEEVEVSCGRSGVGSLAGHGLPRSQSRSKPLCRQ
ncbi:protein SMALL AUXIN UP-REGULATED RNA 9-like [Nymphaea colorata]|uniref:Auxin-responsive protein n=1 Tax=Nymphaea colorata TaxID=210225 RepID=A0A5K1H4J1_9MAGN|nr:protein SMALL AUXIN UP-REGULATED RNA 9-like [Nymphaea colorata]VVW82853.1 unnamed protein product [Nymphaea colorata]